MLYFITIEYITTFDFMEAILDELLFDNYL